MDQQNTCVAQIWALGPPCARSGTEDKSQPLLGQSWRLATVQTDHPAPFVSAPSPQTHTHLCFSHSNVSTVPRSTTFFYSSVLLFPLYRTRNSYSHYKTPLKVTFFVNPSTSRPSLLLQNFHSPRYLCLLLDTADYMANC